MLGLFGKEERVRINHLPKKRTLADANKGRKVEFFEEVYNSLLINPDYALEIYYKLRLLQNLPLTPFSDIEI